MFYYAFFKHPISKIVERAHRVLHISLTTTSFVYEYYLRCCFIKFRDRGVNIGPRCPWCTLQSDSRAPTLWGATAGSEQHDTATETNETEVITGQTGLWILFSFWNKSFDFERIFSLPYARIGTLHCPSSLMYELKNGALFIYSNSVSSVLLRFCHRNMYAYA